MTLPHTPPSARATWSRSVLPPAAASVLILAACAGVALSWAPDLPDPVAAHWGAGGTPDRFDSLGSYVLLMVAVGALGTAAFAVVGAAWGQSAATRRLAAGTMVWISALVGTALLASLWQQRGLADAADADGASLAVLLTLLVPLLPAAAAPAP